MHSFFPNGTKKLCADDLIILSRSKIGLQHCLNTLHSYCETWMLKINPKKTKIMIFQNAQGNSLTTTLKLAHEHVEIVQQYTHLGTRLTQTRNLTLALKHLKEKAFFSIRKDTLLNPKTASQIFDTIFPILSYKSSEVWTMYTKQNFKT